MPYLSKRESDARIPQPLLATVLVFDRLPQLHGQSHHPAYLR